MNQRAVFCLIVVLWIIGLTRSLSIADTAIPITSDRIKDQSPSWSPDGLQLVFARGNRREARLFTIPVSGGIPTPLPTSTRGAQEPAWSPDGKWIAYSYFGDIWVIPSTGGEATRIISTIEVDGYRWPTWSPDGSQIAYTHEARFSSSYQPSISVHNWTGDAPHWIISNSMQPTWSPRGDFVAFKRYENIFITAPTNSPSSTIREATQITVDGGSLPSWSPDGEWIAYAGPSGSIWIIPSIGGEAIQITDSGRGDSFPAWSPDGKQIAFSRGRDYILGGYRDIWIIDVESVCPSANSCIKLEQVGPEIERSDSSFEQIKLRATVIFGKEHWQESQIDTEFNDIISFVEVSETPYYDGINGISLLPQDIMAVEGVAEIKIENPSHSIILGEVKISAKSPHLEMHTFTNPISIK